MYRHRRRSLAVIFLNYSSRHKLIYTMSKYAITYHTNVQHGVKQIYTVRQKRLGKTHLRNNFVKNCLQKVVTFVTDSGHCH